MYLYVRELTGWAPAIKGILWSHSCRGGRPRGSSKTLVNYSNWRRISIGIGVSAVPFASRELRWMTWATEPCLQALSNSGTEIRERCVWSDDTVDIFNCPLGVVTVRCCSIQSMFIGLCLRNQSISNIASYAPSLRTLKSVLNSCSCAIQGQSGI